MKQMFQPVRQVSVNFADNEKQSNKTFNILYFMKTNLVNLAESVIFDLTDSLGKKETRKGITSVKKLNICERTITENINYII